MGPRPSRQAQPALHHRPASCPAARYGSLDVLEPLWGALEEAVMHSTKDIDEVRDEGCIVRGAGGGGQCNGAVS